MHARFLGALRTLDRGGHHCVAHDFLSTEGLGPRIVLVHQPGEEVLIETSPVDADSHWLLIATSHLNHLHELRIALAAATDVARVDSILRQSLRARRRLTKQLVAVEMKVTDQRDI